MASSSFGMRLFRRTTLQEPYSRGTQTPLVRVTGPTTTTL
jgi:hypothetical protein